MTNKAAMTPEQHISDLQQRLSEAEDTLDAIRRGAVDALVVKGVDDQKIFTLQSADYTYRMLIESMNQGAFTINFDGTILYSNRQFSTMLKTPLEQIVGHDILQFIMPEDQPVIQALTQTSRQTDMAREIRLRPARSGALTVIASITTVYQEGVSPYLCVVVTDLTERKQAEEAKDDFISLASHQLRTPATTVKQYLNMLIDGMFGELNDTQVEALKKANEGNDRGLKIVEDLLKVAQIDAGKIALNRHYADLSALLKVIVTEQSLQYQKHNQHLTYRQPGAPVIANIDTNLIRMVVENLLDNASKYMPEGGTATVSCESTDNGVVFSVADTGVGMSKKDISKLFQKFSRVPNSLSVKVGGSGLGLYWVKKVIDLHAATIFVSSAVGKGTMFKVTLPKGDSGVADTSS